jgi:murein DD-endopeptidase MepM/ murein hydrolase activator NlpD
MIRLSAALLSLGSPALASSPDVFRQLTGLSVTVETEHAYPGGVLVVKLHPQRPIGAATAALNGRRAPFYPATRGLRALLPVPLGTPGGSSVVGLEIHGRLGRRRIPLEVEIAPRTYSDREILLPDPLRAMLELPDVGRDGRRLFGLLRTESSADQRAGRFRAPIDDVAGGGFGARRVYPGAPVVETLFDSVHGDGHRGVDYLVPPGTPVLAPAAGSVLLAGPLALGGETVVLDHGQGVLSVLFHLGRLQVQEGAHVEAGAPVGASGQSGFATTPHVHWGVYVHGVAVDPAVLLALSE